MNILSGRITDIKICSELSLIQVESQDVLLSAIIIETPKTVDYLKVGNEIDVLFKETEVIICTASTFPISLQNRIPCTIKKIKKGDLLCSINMLFKTQEITSIITRNAVNSLNLKEGMQVTAMIKTNEMMISTK
jgi:molybdopterin-binding protein